MSTIGITGGTGFVGKRLTARLISAGHRVLIFSRQATPPVSDNITYIHWDPYKNEVDTRLLPSLDAVVHLAGEGVADKRWSPARKRAIADSRIIGTRFLTATLTAHAPQCRTLVAASAIGFYGADAPGGKPFTENSSPAQDFLGSVCQQWEKESLSIADRVRTVVTRFGIVFGTEAGAFPQLLQPLSMGVVPIIGTGRQVMSWIHVEDVCNIIEYALEHPQVQGIYNTVAPHPVTNAQLMHHIALKKKGIRIPIKVPAFLMKMILGEMSIEVLKSCTVSAQKIEQAGFSFSYPTLSDALGELMSH